jgi:hypothetical protein
MSIIYNPNDVSISQMNSDSSSFVEQVLSSSQNSLVMFNSTSHLVALPTQSFVAAQSITSSYSNGAVTILPVVYLFNNSTAYVSGSWHSYPSSSTCGLQEVLNYLNDCTTDLSSLQSTHGGKIIFGPGIFTMTNTASINTYNISLIFEGSGVTATGILYSGSVAGDVISLKSSAEGYVNFSMNHMFLSSILDTTNYLLVVGTFGKLDIRDSWFGYWPLMISGGPDYLAGLQPPSYSNGYTATPANNLCGVYIEGNSVDNLCIIDGCDFLGLNIGLVDGADHSVISSNMFLFCGNIFGGTTNWFTNSYSQSDIYNIQSSMNWLGGSIVIGHSNHQNHKYHNNYFYGGTYAYIVDDSHTVGSVIRECGVITYNDGFESILQQVLMSPQSQIVQINPRYYNCNQASYMLNSMYGLTSGVYVITSSNSPSLLGVQLNNSYAQYTGYSNVDFQAASLITTGNVSASLFYGTSSWATSSSFSSRSISSTSASYAKTASYSISSSVLSPSFINIPNGVAGLDSNDNLSGVVIPLQDTQQNLGGIVPASGQLVYVIDTKASFIGDGTSSIAPTFVSQSINNLVPLTRFSPLSGSGVDGVGKVGIVRSFSYVWPVMFQDGVGSFVLYQIPNDLSIYTMLAKITTFVWEGEDAYDELHVDTIGAYWAGSWLYAGSSTHISSSAVNTQYNYTASFNITTRQLIINYNNQTGWNSPGIIKLEVDISNNVSP